LEKLHLGFIARLIGHGGYASEEENQQEELKNGKDPLAGITHKKR